MKIGANVENKRTGSRITVVGFGDDSLTLKFESTTPTNVPDFPKHVHERWIEEFEMVRGRGRYWANGDWHDIGEGERVRHDPNTPHIHPMNAGDEPFEMLQFVKSTIPDPDGIRDTIATLFTLMDRHAQGKVRLMPLGYPLNPLYFAGMGRVLGSSASYDAMIPIAAQKFSAATMGRLALALGVNPIDDKWL